MTDRSRQDICAAFRELILAEHVSRSNPQSWQSVHPAPGTPEADRYERERQALVAAASKLWMLTDCEYTEDGFTEHVWNWRHWSVMSRKCTWYLRLDGVSNRAARTMAQLEDANLKLAEACGCTDIYKSGCDYIEEQFPGLKRK